MGSIYDLKSWSREKLTDSQRKQFATIEVGESFHSMRTTFEVKCLKCNRVLHEETNNPSACIDGHMC